ncbi:hypothetical protein N9M49_03290 [Flavicella sp.]|nr:hypothetical protein [Flavicella sp.]
MKKTFSILSIIALFLIMTSCDGSVKKTLRDTSHDLNKTLPQTLDKYTVLNTSTVIDESFMYSYTMDKKFLDDYSISKSYWIENQVSNLTNFYCTDPDFKWFRDNNINVIWRYNDLNGNHFETIEINRSDCN